MPASSEQVPADSEQVPASSEQVVVLPKHLHARPAGQVAQAAARYADTTIELFGDGRSADARSILAVLGLGAVAGNEVRVRAVGDDAVRAATAIIAILAAQE
jgi:phosphotransferase system HPr (HPr) family protein